MTTWGTGARVAGARRARGVRSAVNVRANAIEVDVPWKRLGRVGRHARIWLVTGLNAGHGRFLSPLPDASGVFNVAFRPHEARILERFPESSWGEKQQARALAERDVARFAHGLPVARLRAGRSRPFVPRPGFYTRVFRSRLRLGEGIDRFANQRDAYRAVPGGDHPQFLSPWQPYGLYIPRGWTPRRRVPLTLFGHGLGANHIEYRVFTPRLLRQLWQMTASQADELVPIGGSDHMADVFRRRGNRYVYYRHVADEHHEHLYEDVWTRTRDWLARYRLRRNPPLVVYKRYPRMDLRRRGLVFDGAYWVDGIRLRRRNGETSHGTVRARSYALGGYMTRPRRLPTRIYREPPPATPATVTGQVRVPVRRVARRNALSVDLANVARVAFDTRRMRLSLRRPLRIAVVTDGPSWIRLRGRSGCARATLGGQRMPVARTRRAVTLLVGHSARVTLRPCRARA